MIGNFVALALARLVRVRIGLIHIECILIGLEGFKSTQWHFNQTFGFIKADKVKDERLHDALVLNCDLLFLASTDLVSDLKVKEHCNKPSLNKVVCFNPCFVHHFTKFGQIGLYVDV